MTEDVARAHDMVAGAERVVVLTGAGVSAESGVPTFRGAQGLWKSHRPEELATPEAFRRDPKLVWEWYAWRRAFIAECEPNAAHRALAGYALAGKAATTLITQNVDGLHHRAADAVSGADVDGSAAYPLEVHGAIHRDRCSLCGERTPGRTDIDATDESTLPRCDCGGLLRPDVVWFGEVLDADVLGASFEAARAADVCLVVGTSAVVYPAAHVPEVARQAGGRVVEINPERTPLTAVATVSLRGPATELVPAVLSTSGVWPG